MWRPVTVGTHMVHVDQLPSSATLLLALSIQIQHTPIFNKCRCPSASGEQAKWRRRAQRRWGMGWERHCTLTFLVLPALLPRGEEVRKSTSTCDQSWVVRTHGDGQPGHKRLTGCRHKQVARLLVPGRVLLGSMFDVPIDREFLGSCSSAALSLACL